MPVSFSATVGWVAKSKCPEKQRDNIASLFDGNLDLAPQPIAGLAAAIQCGWGEDQQEVSARFDVAGNDLLEVPARNAAIIEEDIIALIL